MNTKSSRRTDAIITGLCVAQGAYYLLGGIWPLVSRRTFEKTLGHKHDFWLSETSALQVALAGALLLRAARSGRISRDLPLLAGGTAAIMAVMDVYCQNRPGTTRMYLLDVVAEAAFIAGWTWALGRSNSPEQAGTERRERALVRTCLQVGRLRDLAGADHLAKALEAVPGVRSVELDHETGRAEIEHDGANPKELIAAAEEEGFQVSLT